MEKYGKCEENAGNHRPQGSEGATEASQPTFYDMYLNLTYSRHVSHIREKLTVILGNVSILMCCD